MSGKEKGALTMFRAAMQRISALKDPARRVTPEAIAQGEALVGRGQAPLWTAAEVTGLPMDEASRMARADSSDRMFPAFHATDKDFQSFDPQKSRKEQTKLVHTSYDATGANSRLDHLADEKASKDPSWSGDDVDGSQIMPLMVGGNTIPVWDRGSWPLQGTMWDIKHAGVDIDPASVAKEGVAFRNSYLQDRLRDAGIDGLRYKNEYEGGSAFATPFPDRIRSKFAAFDPANEGTGYILGSHPVATTAAGGLSLYQMLKNYLGPEQQ